MTQEEHC